MLVELVTHYFSFVWLLVALLVFAFQHLWGKILPIIQTCKGLRVISAENCKNRKKTTKKMLLLK